MLLTVTLLAVVNLGVDALRLENKDAPGLRFDVTKLTDALDPSENPQLRLQWNLSLLTDALTGDGIDFEDGLAIQDQVHVPAARARERTFEGGYQLAERWNRYANGALYEHFMKLYGVHFTDAVASKLHNFMFIDNVKAGSSSVRALLSTALNRTWERTDFPNCNKTGGQGMHRKRYSTGDFVEQEKLFKFSVVRDPVAKFESGVRQAWFQNQLYFGRMTADEILDEVIDTWEFGNRSEVLWLNEHLQPSSYRLFTFGSGTHPSLIKADFLVQLERFDSSWPEVVESLDNVDETTGAFLREHVQEKVNSRFHNSSSKLSQAGIKRMCESELYKFEWAVFDYMLPNVCQ